MSMRVAITTSPDNAGRFVRRLEEAGLEPVLLPCIRIERSPTAVLEPLRRAAIDADWIVCTSRRAIEITWTERMPSRPRVAAVGRTTADAVRAAGGNLGLTGTGGASELCGLLQDRVAGQVVVFPHARAADQETIRELRAANATVVAAPAYETVAIAPAGDPVDAVILGSPSAVDGWLRSRSLGGLLIAVIGQTTATAVRANGHEPEIVPSIPDIDEVVAAVAAHAERMAERSPR
jgi:uroporphyrinogen-III synthase